MTAMYLMIRAALGGRAAAGVLVLVIGVGVVNAQVQLSVQPGVQLSWLTNTKDTYHLQWSPNPVGIWTDLIVVGGNGTTNTVFDPVPGGTRLYQVLDVVPGTPAVPGNLVTNGGFENGNGATATNHPIPAILEVLKTQEISLIIMGTQGKSFIQEIFLGSVAHNISRLATCPVLLHPPASRQSRRKG